MSNDLKAMYKKVILFNVIIGIIFSIIISLFFKGFVLIFITGLLIAILNFVINGFITSIAITKNKYKGIALISFFLRVVIVAAIGYLFFTYNKLDVVAYMLGYTTQFLGFIFYALSIKNT